MCFLFKAALVLYPPFLLLWELRLRAQDHRVGKRRGFKSPLRPTHRAPSVGRLCVRHRGNSDKRTQTCLQGAYGVGAGQTAERSFLCCEATVCIKRSEERHPFRYVSGPSAPTCLSHCTVRAPWRLLMLGLSLAASNNRGGLNYFLPLKTVGGGQPMAATVAPLSCQKPRLLPASAPLSLEHSFQPEGCFRAPEIC